MDPGHSLTVGSLVVDVTLNADELTVDSGTLVNELDKDANEFDVFELAVFDKCINLVGDEVECENKLEEDKPDLSNSADVCLFFVFAGVCIFVVNTDDVEKDDDEEEDDVVDDDGDADHETDIGDVDIAVCFGMVYKTSSNFVCTAVFTVSVDIIGDAEEDDAVDADAVSGVG